MRLATVVPTQKYQIRDVRISSGWAWPVSRGWPAVAMNLLGDGLRDVLDPRTAGEPDEH